MDGDPIIEVRSPGGSRVDVVVSGRLEIGRDCAGLVVDDALLSRHHLVVSSDRGAVVVEDLRSRNGTTVDGAPVDGPTRLSAGQTLLAGGTRIRLSPRVATTPGPPTPRPGEDASRNALRDTVARVPILAPGDLEPRVSPAVPTTERTSQRWRTGPVAGPQTTTIRAIADLVSNDPGTAAAVHATTDPGTTMTFLFSDIESSTERTAAVGDRVWYGLLAAHNRVVEEAITRHDGTLVKAIGDGYMATFGSARRAVRAATSIQHALDRQPIGPRGAPIKVRIGLHTGEAIASGGDLFGFHVNLAARVAEAAAGGQVLVSALTRAVVEVSGDVHLGAPFTVHLKGIGEAQSLSELLWDDDVRATAPSPPPPPPPP